MNVGFDVATAVNTLVSNAMQFREHDVSEEHIASIFSKLSIKQSESPTYADFLLGLLYD
jgi:hypothetical protein